MAEAGECARTPPRAIEARYENDTARTAAAPCLPWRSAARCAGRSPGSGRASAHGWSPPRTRRGYTWGTHAGATGEIRPPNHRPSRSSGPAGSSPRSTAPALREGCRRRQRRAPVVDGIRALDGGWDVRGETQDDLWGEGVGSVLDRGPSRRLRTSHRVSRHFSKSASRSSSSSPSPSSHTGVAPRPFNEL